MAFESLTNRLQQAMSKIRRKEKFRSRRKRNDARNPFGFIRSRR